MNLHQKLVEIRKAVDYAKKDTKGYDYSYVSGTQLLGRIRPVMDDLGVLLIPAMTNPELQSWTESRNQKDKIVFIVSSPMTMTWVNAEDPEDKIVVPWFMVGKQNDPSKAGGSGLTFFLRYFILDFFNVPNDELDPDAFQEKQGTKKEPNHPSNVKATTKEIDKILASAADNGWLEDDAIGEIKYKTGINKPGDLLALEVDKLVNHFKDNPKTPQGAAQEPESAPESGEKGRYPWIDKGETGFSTLVWSLQNSGKLAVMKKEDPNQYEAMNDKWGRICKESDWPPEQDF